MIIWNPTPRQPRGESPMWPTWWHRVRGHYAATAYYGTREAGVTCSCGKQWKVTMGVRGTR